MSVRMPVTNVYDKINSAFELAIKKMQENLQYLADNDKVSDKFLSMQNLILKSLIDFQNQTELYISDLEMENMQLSLNIVKERKRKIELQQSFEAICIIHGIMDFPIWMNRGRNYLVNEAIDLYKENTFTLPSRFKEYLDRLSKGDRETIEKILYKL